MEEFDAVTGGTSIRSGTNGAICYWPLSMVPRRSPDLHLEPLLSLPDGGTTKLGPFKIANPWFAKFPQWRAEPVPQTRENHGLTLTLSRFTSGGAASHGALAWFNRFRKRVDSPVTRLDLSLHENGSDVDDYSVYSITFSDATGNRWEHFPDHRKLGRSAWRNGNTFELQGRLWSGEEA